MLGMMIIKAAFLCTGLLFALTTSRLLPDGVGDMLVAMTFAGGVFTMLVQVYRGLRLGRLTLENEWDLRDIAPEVLRSVSDPGSAREPHGTLFVPESLDGSHRPAPTATGSELALPSWLLYR